MAAALKRLRPGEGSAGWHALKPNWLSHYPIVNFGKVLTRNREKMRGGTAYVLKLMVGGPREKLKAKAANLKLKAASVRGA